MVCNNEGDLRMTRRVVSPLDLDPKPEAGGRYGMHEDSFSSSGSRGVDEKREKPDFEDQETRDVTDEMDYKTDLGQTSGLNASELQTQLNGTGMINDFLVPDLVKEEPRNAYHMTEEEIKEEFMKKNYSSNFSMGGGYEDIDEGERRFKEFQKDMHN